MPDGFYFASPFENPKQHLQKRAMAEPTFQQSALQDYVVDANDVLRFKLVGQEKDLDNESLEFAPEMCHQVKPEAKYLGIFFLHSSQLRFMETTRTSLDIADSRSLFS